MSVAEDGSAGPGEYLNGSITGRVRRGGVVHRGWGRGRGIEWVLVMCSINPPQMFVHRDFSTEVDIALRKWAEDEGRLAQLCTAAAQESVLEVLRNKIDVRRGKGWV